MQQHRTGDRSDGIDGGAVITADLDVNGYQLRLATAHQGFDEFTTDPATTGIDAAIEALGHVAALVNTSLATLAALTDHERHRTT